MSKNEVAKVEEAGLPIDEDMMKMLAADAGAGQENLTSRDLAIPFIGIIQKGSPQINKAKSEFIKGAEVGFFLNNATQQVYPGEQGIILIPCAYQLQAAEWIPRNNGGGLAQNFGTDVAKAESLIVRKDETTGRDLTRDGNEIVIAGTHYCLLVNPETGSFYMCVASLSSTQLKKSRRWNSLMSQQELALPGGQVFKLPTFGRSYVCTSGYEENKKGDWYGWNITAGELTMKLPRGKEIYEAAKKFHESVQTGAVQSAAVGGEETASSAANAETAPPAF